MMNGTQKRLMPMRRRVLGVEAPIADWFAEDGIAEPEIEARLIDAADRHMAEKAVRLGPDIMRMAEKNLLLQVLDQQWKEHLLTLDQLRQGITLRAYGQKDPLNEYKREAFLMFETMLANMRETTSMVLSHVEIRQPDEGRRATNCTSRGIGHCKSVAKCPLPMRIRQEVQTLPWRALALPYHRL
jgi:preprotein translocase subunit SecA